MMPFPERHLNHISQSTTFLHTVPTDCNLEEQLEFIASSAFPSLVRPWRERVEIRLEAGDALLIPAGWWHYTYLHSAGVGLNWWFMKDCF
jgi:hypothetical protein